MNEALREKVIAAIDALDTVAVEWAPAHSAPYVSRDVVQAVVSAVLLSARAPEAGGLDVARLATAMAGHAEDVGFEHNVVTCGPGCAKFVWARYLAATVTKP